MEMALALLEKLETMESAEQLTDMVEAIGDRLLIVVPIEVARFRRKKVK